MRKSWSNITAEKRICTETEKRGRKNVSKKEAKELKTHGLERRE